MSLGKKTVISVNIPSQLLIATDLIYKMTNHHIDIHQLVDFISRNRPYNNIDYDAKASTEAILLSDIFVENIEHYQNNCTTHSFKSFKHIIDSLVTKACTCLHKTIISCLLRNL